MEEKDFNQSLRNIPFGARKEYVKQLTNSVRRTVFSMRWAAAFFLNIIESNDTNKETYGFPSQKKVPFVEELREFSSRVTDLIDNISWRTNVSNPVQQNLRNTLNDLNDHPDKMYVKSDKGDKHYVMSPEDYGSLLKNHLTSDYKKGSLDDFNRVLDADRQIAQELDIADRVFANIPRESFGTLKDGKHDFRTNPKMRLLNPTKMELGRVSKQLIEKVVSEVREKTGLLQWKNTTSCLQWFDKIQDKNQCTFMQFDLANFYGSISKELLDEAVAWASTITNIDEKTKKILYHCRKKFLILSKRDLGEEGQSRV